MNIDQGLKTFWSLVEYLQHAANEQQPIDRVEETVFRGLLVTGRLVLESFLQGVIQGVRPSFIQGSGQVSSYYGFPRLIQLFPGSPELLPNAHVGCQPSAESAGQVVPKTPPAEGAVRDNRRPRQNHAGSAAIFSESAAAV